MQEKSFFSALFDLSFSSFITTKIVKFLYVLTMVIFGNVALAYVVFAFSQSAALGLFVLVILAPLGFLFYLIYTRVVLELFIAIFRIMESNLELVALARQANAGSTPPPASAPPSAPAWSPPPPVDPSAPTTPMPPPPEPPTA